MILLLTAFTAFTLTLAALALWLALFARCLPILDRLRQLFHQAALDAIQVYQQAHQAHVDLDRQRAALEIFREHAHMRLIAHRLKLQARKEANK